MGRNPLQCDCRLKWLNEYFRTRSVERSGITCSMPKRLAKKTIGTIQTNKFRCHGNNTIINDSCEPPTECPTECACTGTVVDCKGKNLFEIPINLPEITTEM